MSVNKRREPTTASQLTRRHVRRANFRTGCRTWRVVRAWGEIATAIRTPARCCDSHAAGRLAGIFRQLGIFGVSRASFSMGNGGGMGHRSRIPHPGGVKQRKPGSHWGVGVFGCRGRAVCRRWGVTR
ncbi:hypothetical protein C3492_34275 [Streptomyces sp. Ru62]|nr:hypothetical protein C3492_34275 [Streptomyces sp. Ru62]